MFYNLYGRSNGGHWAASFSAFFHDSYHSDRLGNRVRPGELQIAVSPSCLSQIARNLNGNEVRSEHCPAPRRSSYVDSQ